MSELVNSQTYAAPYNAGGVDGCVYVSPTQSNTNGDNSVDIDFTLEAVTPDAKDAAVNYRIDIVLEEEVAPGKWVPKASQFPTNLNGTNRAVNQIIEYGPQFIVDPGVQRSLNVGGVKLTEVSPTNGSLGPDFRVKVIVNPLDPENSADQLSSITFSLAFRKYKR